MSFHGTPAQNRTGRNTGVVRAHISPTPAEIHRAAAWWAGEGSVSCAGGHLAANIAQKEIAVLEWLRDRFGGSILMRKKRNHLDPCHTWNVCGPRARGFLMTIYSCIGESPRRQAQIERALIATGHIRKRGPKPTTKCKYGHEKDAGRCKVCAARWRRDSRAKEDNAEKHRRRERQRYYDKKRRRK